MSDLREFILENVRCFQGEQRADIRPITLLVGENSTGKTSFLGSYRVLCQAIDHKNPFRISAPFVISTLGPPDFNVEPFQMGAFRDIVRAKSGKSNEIDEFVLGCSVKNESKKYDILLTFVENGSEPTISSFCFRFSSKSYMNIKPEKGTLEIPNCTIKLNDSFDPSLAFHLLYYLFQVPDFKDLAVALEISKQDAKMLGEFLQKEFTIKSGSNKNKGRFIDLVPPLGQVKSIAPLRSKPKRTYDPITESPTSEGEHIPMLMMRLLRTKDIGWDVLHDALVKFGRQSGLFSEIKIKSHGKQINDPFQLQVRVRAGPQSNIMDVGYGINQILPILVEIMHSDSTTFLLQQPEVHLHPRGQAEFSTFLAESVSQKKHSFLIETHSDYIIDRVRISVRDKIIKPDDVSILYFDPKKRGGAVTIHNIKVDGQGNLENAPPSYREFFMRETDNLLGFKK